MHAVDGSIIITRDPHMRSQPWRTCLVSAMLFCIVPRLMSSLCTLPRSPARVRSSQQQLRAEDKVIRVSTRRPSTKMDRIASTHERSNPWDMEWRRRNGIEQPVHNRRRTPPKNKWY